MTTAPDTPPLAFLYRRVSTEEQARTGLSLDLQESLCRAAAEAAGYTVVEVFTDAGQSGRSTRKRPAYRAMLSRLSECDAIYALRLDRYGRSVRDIFSLVDECFAHGVVLRAVHSTIDLSSAMGRAMVGIAAVISALEAELTQERVLEAMTEIPRQGRAYSHAPYGYSFPRDAAGKVIPRSIMAPDPQTGPIARGIFADFAAGKPVIEICRHLHERGIPSATGKTIWYPSMIRGLVTRQSYLGKVTHARTAYLADGLHEPLIDRATWDSCQHRMRANQSVAPRARTGSLGGLLRCGYCGAALNVAKGDSRRPNNANRSYCCLARKLVTPAHPPLFCTCWVAEEYLWMMTEWLLSDEAQAEYQAQASQSRAHPDMDDLRAEQAHLEGQVRYNLQAAREGAVPLRVLAEENAPLMARLGEVERGLSRLSAQSGQTHHLDMRTTLQQTKQSDYQQQRLFLSRLYSEVRYTRETITFVLTHPDAPNITIRRQRMTRRPTDRILRLDFI